MDKLVHPTLCIGCNYLSMMELKLIHDRKRDPSCARTILFGFQIFFSILVISLWVTRYDENHPSLTASLICIIYNNADKFNYCSICKPAKRHQNENDEKYLCICGIRLNIMVIHNGLRYRFSDGDGGGDGDSDVDCTARTSILHDMVWSVPRGSVH